MCCQHTRGHVKAPWYIRVVTFGLGDLLSCNLLRRSLPSMYPGVSYLEVLFAHCELRLRSECDCRLNISPNGREGLRC